ncbi:hypothetical protein [Sphingomonas soli]|uniref:hypothetical protein n=1 Tax=Sphingomonas soli TaxID=266127 RepID=UPI00082993C3|nr:hypothetical protein [Sphingomonas soli]
MVFGGAAILLSVAAPAQAQFDPDLGQIVLAGLSDVCVPVIESGDSLAEAATQAGFVEVTGENREALGGGPGMSWWMFELADAVLVVGRDLKQAGSACQIGASVPVARIGKLDEAMDRWAARATPAFKQIEKPAGGERDAIWVWERSAGGSVQRLRLSLTRHDNGTATGTLLYGLLPPHSR